MIISESTHMLQIGETLVSLDLLDHNFSCAPEKCMGKCCVLGDYGAPLEQEELEIISRLLHLVKKYMSDEGIRQLEKHGFYTKDDSDELVTGLIDGKECLFAFFEDGIARCSIEKTSLQHNTGFLKPVSCHLYPVRVQKYHTFSAVNYNQWDICTHARIKGESLGLPLYRFLEDALVRKFGQEWFNELDLAAQALIDDTP
ncbi:MAG: DUF3109 family protein [Bacteroidota bacterium]